MYDELLELGYDRSYPTMTRQLRDRGLRPACEQCKPAKGRAVAVIEHPPAAGDVVTYTFLFVPMALAISLQSLLIPAVLAA